MYTWKHGYNEYMHMYVYSFFLKVACKAHMGTYFHFINFCMLSKKNEWLKTYSQRSFYLDKEIKTPFPLTFTEKLWLPEARW